MSRFAGTKACRTFIVEELVRFGKSEQRESLERWRRSEFYTGGPKREGKVILQIMTNKLVLKIN